MGGGALKQYGVFTERKDTETFNKIGNCIREKLFADLGLESEVIKCYHTKLDHGDLDLLINVDSGYQLIDFSEYIQNTFKPKAIDVNSNVYSFDLDNFQIDCILINESIWGMSNLFYSYDPLGNIMNKTFHQFGLSYGWNGMYYKYRKLDGKISNDILISRDPQKIFEFASFDYERYLLGFETLEDIFQYSINNKYFNRDIFQFENLRHVDKRRNKRRKSYNQFLEYLKTNSITKSYSFDPNKDNYIPIINSYFPEAKLIETINLFNEHDKRNKILSQKFNGDMVMEWIGELQGKEVGELIGKFKNMLGENFNDFILNNNYQVIQNSFMEMFNNEKR